MKAVLIQSQFSGSNAKMFSNLSSSENTPLQDMEIDIKLQSVYLIWK